MSADIMPCGCEGHADNTHLCRHPQVLEDVHLALFARAPAMSAGDVALAEWEEKRRAARASSQTSMSGRLE